MAAPASTSPRRWPKPAAPERAVTVSDITAGHDYTRGDISRLRRESERQLALLRREVAALAKMDAAFAELERCDRELEELDRAERELDEEMSP